MNPLDDLRASLEGAAGALRGDHESGPAPTLLAHESPLVREPLQHALDALVIGIVLVGAVAPPTTREAGSVPVLVRLLVDGLPLLDDRLLLSHWATVASDLASR